MTKATYSKNEIFQLALDSAPSGIMLVGEQGEIQYVNQTLVDIFGYALEELLGQSIEILIPEQFAKAHRHHVQDFTLSPAPREMGSGRDLEGISKDGRRFPVEIGLRPVQTSSGRIVVATVNDISIRKAIEDRLHRHEEQLEVLVAERTQELEETQREKERVLDQLIQAEKMTAVGTLVSGIGHEINSPLYVLVAVAEALADEEDIDQCHAYGGEILKHAKNIAETVKNLSQYVQPGIRDNLQRVDMITSINEAVHLAQRTLSGNQVEFKIITESVPEILARSAEIQQVLFNVVRNSVQAIDGVGQIEIRAVQEGDWIIVHIEDDGEGIPREYLKQVFDPFFTTKGPDVGEGLGLYIVSQIVTRYQGTIDAENAEDSGARFVIRFPVADRKNTEEGKNHETSCSSSG